jgi:hypothetical protein
MSPGKKVSDLGAGVKGKKRVCPYCGFEGCWRHGRYSRKGFHRGPGRRLVIVVWVQQYLCPGPSCGRTFGVLPPGVLPYQRFFQADFFTLAGWILAGRGAYAIARDWVLGVGLTVIRRARERIWQVKAWVEKVAREAGMDICPDLRKTVAGVLHGMDWPSFTGRWFRALYHRRAFPESAPHNPALPS